MNDYTSGRTPGTISGYLLIATLIAGCGGGGSPPPPDADIDPAPPAEQQASAAFAGEPSIRGTITEVGPETIRVEEQPADQSGSAKAIVRISADTPLRSQDGGSADIEDLRVGARVSVWYTGLVAESYPVQVRAGAIEIDG